MKKRKVQELVDELREAEESSWDGRRRIVEDSAAVLADGHVWGIVNDHGNVELCHKDAYGRIYYHGGLV